MVDKKGSIPPAGRTQEASDPSLSSPVRERFDAFELDELNARLLRDGQPISIAPTPFALLCALVRQHGSLITKGALLDAVWGHRYVSDSVLKTAISELRTVLGDDARRPRYIETVSRRGYRFIGHMNTAVDAPAESTQNPRSSARTFVGRVDALSRLHRAWNFASSGQRMIVWIVGDPGVGKTMLLDHFVAQLHDVGIGRGQCVEQFGAGEPYMPILDALGELCRMDQIAVDLLHAVAPLWLMQLPWLATAEQRETLRRELAGARPDRMLREFGEFTDRYTEHRPLLLVTEDLHWSDQATIQLIDYLARRRGRGRLMWIATFRLTDVIAHDHPLKTVRNEFRLHGLSNEIVLDPFSEEEVATYIARHAPSLAMTESDVRALHERTDGLPLFVAQFVSDLVARKSVAPADSTVASLLGGLAMPENLAAIIDHYLARLTIEQRSALEAAAVCGMDFRVDTVATALEQDVAHVARICDGLARAHRWLVADQAGPTDAGKLSYRFRHALFQQGIYGRIEPRLRARLHRRVGAALEQDRSAGFAVALSELVMHFERGAEPAAALRHYVDAAESLLHVSPTEVLQLTERGLALVDQIEQNEERDALELSLWTLRGVSAEQLFGMGVEDAKAALQRAQALLTDVPRHPARGSLLFRLGFMLCLRSEHAEALALAKHVEALAQETADSALLIVAYLVQGVVLSLHGHPSAARDWLERGLAASESLGDATEGMFIADPRVTLHSELAIQLLHLGLIDQAREQIKRARSRARACRQAIAQGVAIWCEGLIELRLGNTARVAELAGEIQAVADEFTFAQGDSGAKWMRGWVAARSGDPLGGFHLIREAYEEDVRLGLRAGGSEVLCYAAEALLRGGDWRAAQRQLDEAFEIVDTFGERIYVPQLLLIEAAIADARGDAPSAYESMRRAVAEARAQEAPWLELMALRTLCARADASEDARRALAALAAQIPASAALPSEPTLE